MMKNYKRTFRSLITEYVDTQEQVNFGGNIPNIILLPPPSPSPTGTPLPTPTPSPTSLPITPTNTSTPTNTPSITPTNTPTITTTPTMTPTPSAPAFDADAAVYLAAVLAAGGTLDATMSAATNTLFTYLKANNVYNEIEAMYPFLGATAASHSINAVNPGTYDITWVGGMTHNISGSTGNGVNGYGNTNYSNLNYAVNSIHFSIYQNTENTPSGTQECLGGTTGVNPRVQIQTNVTSGGVNNWSWRCGPNISQFGANGGDIAGSWISRRDGTTDSYFYKDGNLVDTISGAYTNGATPRNMFLFALNVNNVPFTGTYSNNRLAFATLGSGISIAEMADLDYAITQFNTTLGRNFS